MDIQEIGIQEMNGYLNDEGAARDGLFFSAWAGNTWMCLVVINGALQKHRSAKINAAMDWLQKCKNQFYEHNI